MAKNKVKARILADVTVDGKKYQANQAVAFNVDQAKALEKSGQVDTSPAAVAYVVSIGTKVIEHEDDEVAESAATTSTNGSSAGEASDAGSTGDA